MFERNVRRYCDNQRGNTCTGELITEYTQVEECGSDFDIYQSWQVERCAGPETVDASTCRNYLPGESFELLFSAPPYNLLDRYGDVPDGNCANYEYVCAPGEGTVFTPPGYAPAGPQSCQLSCTDGSCGYAQDCVCNPSHYCNAGCQSGGATYGFADQTCYYECDDTCEFSESVVCPQACVLPTLYSNSISISLACADQDIIFSHDLDIDEYCYYHGAPCSDGQCAYSETQVAELRAGYCDFCDENGLHPGSSPCGTGFIDYYGVDYCFYWDPFNPLDLPPAEFTCVDSLCPYASSITRGQPDTCHPSLTSVCNEATGQVTCV